MPRLSRQYMSETPSPSAGELLREVARLYTRAQRVVAECCDSTNSQCLILTELARAGPLALSDLGARLRLEKSWVGRAVDGMIASGLLSKQQNPLDARSWIVSLTAAGRARVKQLNRSLDAHAEQLLVSLDASHRVELHRSLSVLADVLRAANEAVKNCPAPAKPIKPAKSAKPAAPGAPARTRK
jgi:DNA-binding MarR family transcriptional regulator